MCPIGEVSGHIFYNFQLKGEVVKHECCSNNNFILSIIKMIMKNFVFLSFFFSIFEGKSIHYNKSDFFQGSKPLKKVLKNLEKNYFKSPIDP